MKQLKLDEYARRLCAAKEAYDYPAVTCFDFNLFLQKKKLSLYETQHQNVLEVEELIRGQLLSQNIEMVKDGLSNVLYWGYASPSQRGPYVKKEGRYKGGRQYSRICIFRRDVTSKHIDDFMYLLNTSVCISLNGIKSIKMPEFTQMPFVSKLVMFLLPVSSPVLDNKIARFAQEQNMPILKRLTIGTTVSLSKSNMEIYDEWALWCRQIAETINNNPSLPCKGLRAVDVERAIYCRIPNKKDKNQDTTEARLLLAGPDTD